MKRDLIYNIVLFIVALFLFISYMLIVIKEERKALKSRSFFKRTIKYETEYYMYVLMVKKMRKVIFRKKVELLWLSLLCCLKKVFVWSNR